MKVLGIAAEYNPFHNGHKFHMEESKRLTGADCIVAVMSGCFVQRGEPAISDKWTRAKAAVSAGADLVLELPFVCSCNGAAQFAEGAVSVLGGLGCVDFISFGSESGDIDAVKAIAYNDVLINSRDVSYAKAMGDTFAKEGIVSNANDILAAEYIRSLKRLGSDMVPLAVKRCDSGYSSDVISGSFASASKIRSMVLKKEDISGIVPSYERKFLPFDDDIKDRLFRIVSAEILRREPEELDSVPSAGEGIGFKLKKEIRKADGFDSLVDLVRGGRYTRARIKRVLMQILVGTYGIKPEAPYARVLAFNETGAGLLKYIKKNETLKEGFKIITNINREDTDGIYDILRFDIMASDMYNLLMAKGLYDNSEMVMMPKKSV